MAIETPPEVGAASPVDAALARGGITNPAVKKKKVEPVFRVIGDSKIPTSKQLGAMWESRYKAAETARRSYADAWNEAFRYYENDQSTSNNEAGDRTRSNNRVIANRRNESLTQTENLVFSNTATLLPALYSKNPSVEFTAEDQDESDFLQMVQRLVNALMSRKTAPGINLKPKARRGVLSTLLANIGIIRIGWIKKEQSAEAAYNDLLRISKEYETAEDQKRIKELEGQLLALEEATDVLAPAGPTAKVVNPLDFFMDPMSEECDLSDCMWIMELDYMQSSYIRARFMKPGDSESEWKSIYEPSHVMVPGDNGGKSIEDTVNNFTLFAGSSDEEAEMRSYGYKDRDSYTRAQYTRVVWVLDRTTRRVLLYNVNNWKWPIWVWDDPYELPRFFPYFIVKFHESPTGGYSKGEVSYYLNQQDAINEINDERRRTRRSLKMNFLHDKAISPQDVMAVLKGADGTSKGVEVPDGRNLQDMFWQPTPVISKYPEVFDKSPEYQAIDRISSATEVLRGGQFKTNTTNQAIESYQNAASIRLDERVDAIEDWIGDIGECLAQLALMNMTSEEVAEIIGAQAATAWIAMSPREFSAKYTTRVIGGSTQKPTSQAKKSEALEIGQVLGQFTNTAPLSVLKVLLRVFSQAFDEVSLTDEDWKMMEAESMQQLQQTQAPAGEAPTEGGASEQQAIQEQIASLSPEQRAQLEQLVQSGVAPSQALAQVSQPAA